MRGEVEVGIGWVVVVVVSYADNGANCKGAFPCFPLDRVFRLDGPEARCVVRGSGTLRRRCGCIRPRHRTRSRRSLRPRLQNVCNIHISAPLCTQDGKTMLLTLPCKRTSSK